MTHMVYATIRPMDLRERALAAYQEAELELEHERHKTTGAAAEHLADEARRYAIETLELGGTDLDDLRVLVTPGTSTAVIHVNDMPAFQYRRHFDMRSLHTCPECGARAASHRVSDLTDLGELLAQDPAELLLLDHDRADDATWRCNGLHSWSTVQAPPEFRVELVGESFDGPLSTAAKVAASLGRMAAATANPAVIYPGPHGWLIVAHIDPDPPAYTGDDAF